MLQVSGLALELALGLALGKFQIVGFSIPTVFLLALRSVRASNDVELFSFPKYLRRRGAAGTRSVQAWK